MYIYIYLDHNKRYIHCYCVALCIDMHVFLMGSEAPFQGSRG